METDIKLDDVIEAVIRECRKDNLKYKIKAIACLTTISETFETQNFPVLWELVVPIIKKVSQHYFEHFGNIIEKVYFF